METEEINQQLNALLAAGEYDALLEASDAALAQDSYEPLYYLFKGHALKGLDRDDEALEVLERAIVLDPTDAATRIEYGGAHERLGNFADALNAYEAAVLNDPTMPEAGLYAGNILMILRHPELAVYAYQQSYDIQNDWSLGNKIAELYGENALVDEAAKMYTALLQQNATFPLQVKYGSALLFFLQNGEEHAKIANLATAWRDMFPRDAFVLDVANALISNNVHYVILTPQVVQKVFDSSDESFSEEDPTLPMDGMLASSYEHPEGNLVVAHAGCGTGAYGEFLKPYAAELTGIDLSTKMLDKTHRSGFYNKLFNYDFGSFFAQKAGVYDLIFSGKSLQYSSKLEENLTKMKNALKPTGKIIFALGVNDINDEAVTFATPFRYLYDAGYVEDVLKKLNLSVVHTETYELGIERYVAFSVLKVE